MQNQKMIRLVIIVCAVMVVLLLAWFVGSFLMKFGLGDLFGPKMDSDLSNQSVAGPVDQNSGTEGNTYDAFLEKYSEYVLPDSDSRYLGRRDVIGLSETEVELAILEIQARHGAQFADPQAQAYFDARQWYTVKASTYSLNVYEKANQLLLEVQQGKHREENAYLAQFPENLDYVLDGSDNRYLRAVDLYDMSPDQLIVARNEIYARNGCIFQTQALQVYFYTKLWYVPNMPVDAFDASELNACEKNNIEFIGIYEERAEGVTFSAENPYIAVYETYQFSEGVFPDSSDRELTSVDLLGLNLEELVIARNEIYARNGYTFSSRNLLEYFLQTDWYLPDTPCGDSDALGFTKLEKANISLMKERENFLEKNGAAVEVLQESKYVFVADGACYHIPVVERSGVNAKSINSQLYDRYSKLLQESVFSLFAEERLLTGLTYVVGQKGDVVTVLVRRIDAVDCDGYDVFYLSASSGKTLTAEDVFSAYGMSNEQGYGMIEQAMESYWQRQEANSWSQDSFFQTQKAKTLSDSNIQAVKPWIDKNGELRFCGEFYALAGADSYWYCFNDAGSMIQISCQEH